MISIEEYQALPIAWDVDGDVSEDVYWAVDDAVVDRAVSEAVNREVYQSVDRFVNRAVDRAVNGAVSQDFNGGFKEPPSKLSPLAVVAVIARILWGAIMAWLRNLEGALVDR